jgi:hypothetical protein
VLWLRRGMRVADFRVATESLARNLGRPTGYGKIRTRS